MIPISASASWGHLDESILVWLGRALKRKALTWCVLEVRRRFREEQKSTRADRIEAKYLLPGDQYCPHQTCPKGVSPTPISVHLPFSTSPKLFLERSS